MYIVENNNFIILKLSYEIHLMNAEFILIKKQQELYYLFRIYDKNLYLAPLGQSEPKVWLFTRELVDNTGVQDRHMSSASSAADASKQVSY